MGNLVRNYDLFHPNFLRRFLCSFLRRFLCSFLRRFLWCYLRRFLRQNFQKGNANKNESSEILSGVFLENNVFKMNNCKVCMSDLRSD